MNSVVCVSQVPDTETRIKIGADKQRIDEAGIKFIVSPYDEYALEEAIKTKEAKGGDVTVMTFGPDRAAQPGPFTSKAKSPTPTPSASPRFLPRR